jgi:hypothetical protein
MAERCDFPTWGSRGIQVLGAQELADVTIDEIGVLLGDPMCPVLHWPERQVSNETLEAGMTGGPDVWVRLRVDDHRRDIDDEWRHVRSIVATSGGSVPIRWGDPLDLIPVKRRFDRSRDAPRAPVGLAILR